MLFLKTYMMRNMEADKRFVHRGRFENDLGVIGVANEVGAPLVVGSQPRNFHRNLLVDDLFKKKKKIFF